MTLRRLRSGELLAGAGATALLVLLFLEWFRGAGATATTGWTAVGAPLAVVLAGAVALAAWLVAGTVAGAPVSHQLAAGVLAAAVGAVALAALAVRVTIAQPGLGADLPDAAVSVGVAGYLALAATAVLTLGAWRSIADERTDAPESAFTPPPARPAPPERA